jgi:hypothetical protein
VNQDREHSVPEAGHRNPFWVCLVVFLALTVDGGFRFSRLLEQRRQLGQMQLAQAVNLGRISPALAQAQQLETKLQAVSLDLIRVARTNTPAAQLVREFNIQFTSGADASATTASTNAATR